MACRVFVKSLDVSDSTNRYVRDESESLWLEAGEAEVIAVTALSQTAGRGQRGNVWMSESEKNLLLSLLVKPNNLHVKEQFMLSQMISLAVLRAMRYFGVPAEIKWPNDIYVGNRKLAGILVELDCLGTAVEEAVIGVGLNVNQTSFPVMDRIPVSMAMLSGRSFCLNDVRDRLLECFLCYNDMFMAGDDKALAVEYKRHLKGYMTPLRYSDKDSTFEAVVKDVNSDGRLVLELSSGETRSYSFKEVELLL